MATIELEPVLLPMTACWTGQAANDVFRTEALEGNEAVFLATHTPIRGFNVSGLNADEIEAPSEEGLLHALSNDAKRHAFCAIQGEPGSGKSHLIRWLYINWPKGRDIPLLLQRSDGSLEGALRQLKDNLPKEFLPLFDGIGQRQKATVAGRAAVFHSTLAALLLPEHYDPPLEDRDWCAQWDPSSLLYSPRALQSWTAPLRLLRLISGEGVTGEGERNSESARFNIYDVAELVGLVAQDGASVKGQALLRKLITEGAVIDEERFNQTADELVQEIGSSIPVTVAFVDALNRRKNDAIQNVLGVSAAGLKTLFREIRSKLATRNQRLVLLLEDITSWEGLDDSLIDVLVTNASTRDATASGGDLCDLISVVGLTPQYFRTLKGNYRQRITHEIRLGDAESGGLQDVVTVRDPENRLKFVSRYLAATRADPEALKAWRDDLRHGVKHAPPNKCATCPVQQGCFAAFSDVDGVGLFPFTSNAIRGFFDALKEDDNGMTWKTPRGLIQAVLSPTLSHPETLEAGQYPGPALDRTTFTDQSKHLSGALAAMIDARVSSSHDQERLRRIFTFWGASGRPQTTQSDGRQYFHNVDEDVFKSFRAPWLGGQVAEPISKPATPVVEPLPIEPQPQNVPDTQDPVPDTGRAVDAPLTGSDVPAPSPAVAPTQPAASRTEVWRVGLNPDDIHMWKDSDEKLRNAPLWNKAAHAIVQTIDPRRVGADLWLWERFLTPELVRLEGTTKESAFHFMLPKEPWVLSGLEAFAILSKRRGEWTQGEIEYYKLQLARMMRQLERELSAFFDRRLSVTADGKRWDPSSAAAQVLLARAWLRRAILPSDPPEEQFVSLLSDELEAESNPKARTQQWQTFLDGTSRAHLDLRSMLRRMLALPQGGTAGFGLADGKIARELMQLIGGSKASPAPNDLPNQSTAHRTLEATAEHIRRLAELDQLVARERDLLSDRAERLNEFLREKAVAEHAARLDKVIKAVDVELPDAVPDRVRAWVVARDRAEPIIATSASEVEGLIVDFVDMRAELPKDRKSLLSLLIRARAGALLAILETFTEGENAVRALLSHAEVTAAQMPVGNQGLEEIHRKGKQLMAVADKMRSLLNKDAQRAD